MVRSRSRSPRWEHRSILPTYGRSLEPYVERPLNQSYSGESRGFGLGSGRPVQWRGQWEKWNEAENVESRSGDAQASNVHCKVFEYGQPSPNTGRVGSEHTTTTGRNVSPQEREGNRSYPLPSRPLEDNPYQDRDDRHHDSEEWHSERHHDYNEWHSDHDDRHRHSHQNVEALTRSRSSDEKPKAVRGDPQTNTYERPVTISYGGAENWRDSEGFRSRSLHEERHSGDSRSPGRWSEEFLDRNSDQKRYPEEDEVKGYREASGRGWVPGKHEMIEHERDLKWRGEKLPHNRKTYPSASYGDSESTRVEDVPSDRFEECVQVKSGFTHSQKYPEMHFSSEHHQSFSSERQQGYSSKDKEFTTSSSSNKEVSHFHSNSRRPGTDGNRAEGHHSVSGKYPVPENYSGSFQHVDKKEVRPKSTATFGESRRSRKRNKIRNFIDFLKDRRDAAHKQSNHRSCHVETSRRPIKSKMEFLTVKLDMKKTMNKSRPASSHASARLMSQDLVSIGKKRDEFHHVFQHMGSSFKADPVVTSGDFAQEIITLVHQIKEDHCRSAGLSLHDRFSKLPNGESPQREGKLGPEIHRRIDMSLADLHNREMKPVARKTSTWVAVNPDDLRQDIERRREERLQDEFVEPYQTTERRSERRVKSRSPIRMKASRNPYFKKPSIGFMEHGVRIAKRPITHFAKEYSSFGQTKGFPLESKYRRIYNVGFGRTNHRIFTKHFRGGIARKRRDERELPSSTTDQ